MALVVGVFEGTVRVTSTGLIRIEETLAATARATARDRTGALPVHAIRQAIAAAEIAFTEDQRAAIQTLRTGGALTLPTGIAGAGKTTLLQLLV